jgi:hypothetical protein
MNATTFCKTVHCDNNDQEDHGLRATERSRFLRWLHVEIASTIPIASGIVSPGQECDTNLLQANTLHASGFEGLPLACSDVNLGILSLTSQCVLT